MAVWLGPPDHLAGLCWGHWMMWCLAACCYYLLIRTLKLDQQLSGWQKAPNATQLRGGPHLALGCAWYIAVEGSQYTEEQSVVMRVPAGPPMMPVVGPVFKLDSAQCQDRWV